MRNSLHVMLAHLETVNICCLQLTTNFGYIKWIVTMIGFMTQLRGKSLIPFIGHVIKKLFAAITR